MSKQENNQEKRQICVMGDKENTWKKYVYLENGVLVEQRFVKIENGIEIPCEEGPATHILELTPNFENKEHIKVENISTGESNLIDVIKEPRKSECVKVFNETKNIGSLVRLENGIQVSLQFYKIENNQEIICDPLADEKLYFIPLPNDFPDFSSYNGELPMYDISTREVIKSIPKANIIQFDNKIEIKITEQNKKIADEIISKINELSNDEKEKLIENIQKTYEPITTLEGKYSVSVNEEDLQRIFPTNMPATVYRNVDPATEFGVARFMADQVYHLSSLLNVAEVIHYGEVNYGILASKQITPDNRLDFSYRFTATDPEDANKIAMHIKQQLNGIMRKIWLAAWSIGDEIKKQIFSVSLLRLMRACHPERSSNFSEREIKEFYQTLKSMKPAEFILVKRYKKQGKRKTIEEHEAKFIISFLQVHFESGEKNKTPSEVLISLYDVTPLPTKREKNRYIGAAIKRNTLNLHAKDTAFALWLQTRINQLKGGGIKKKEISSYDFPRSVLIEEANLQRTNTSNSRMANKQLLEKLQRCKEEGIIKKFPSRIGETIKLHWD